MKKCIEPSGFAWLNVKGLKIKKKTVGDAIDEFYGKNAPEHKEHNHQSHIEIRIEPNTGLVCSFKVDGMELAKMLTGVSFEYKAGKYPKITAEFVSDNISIDIPCADETELKTDDQKPHLYQRSWIGTPKSEKVRKILMRQRRERY